MKVEWCRGLSITVDLATLFLFLRIGVVSHFVFVRVLFLEEDLLAPTFAMTFFEVCICGVEIYCSARIKEKEELEGTNK